MYDGKGKMIKLIKKIILVVVIIFVLCVGIVYISNSMYNTNTTVAVQNK